MIRKTFIIWAAAMVAAGTLLAAQTTVISVKEGKVLAETENAQVAVEVGRKAILTPDKNPKVTMDDPLVDDVMEIYRWIEAEKQAKKNRIQTSNISIFKINGEKSFKCAALSAFTPKGKGAKKTIKWGPTHVLKEPKYYDLEGNLLQHEVEKVNNRNGYYTLKLAKPLEAGRKFEYICIFEIDNAIFLREGPLWILPMGHGSGKNKLVYYRFILPESAIYVDATHPPTMMDSVDGRVAATIRIYTGQGGPGNSTLKMAFLWPDKDGTTIADIPPQYRGLRDKTEEEYAMAGRVEAAKIIAGDTYEQQGTPLETLLSLYSAVEHENSEQFLQLIAPDLRDLAQGQMDAIMTQAGGVAGFEFLGMPAVPDKLEDGYEHPVYLAMEGSLICESTLVMTFNGGKWYLKGIEQGRTRTKKSDGVFSTAGKTKGGVAIARPAEPDLGMATYKNPEPGKFMRKWLFLGPISVPWEGDSFFPDDATANRFFETETLDVNRFKQWIGVADKDYQWAILKSAYGVIELGQVFDDWYAVAYAWAQVDMPEQKKAVLGIGSDDCIRVWLNGKLVHDRIGSRGTFPDSDRVPVVFKKGKNQLVIKILNYGGPWGFACRLLE